MSSLPPPDPPPDLAALFASERAAPAPPSAVKEAVRARVQQALVTGASAGSAAAGGAWLKGLAVAVALGAAAGGAWYGLRAPTHAAPHAHATRAPSYAEGPLVAAAPPTASALTETPTAPSQAHAIAPVAPVADAPRSATPAPTTAPSIEAGPETDEALGRENALIERARDALRRRDAGTALEAVRAHAERFPRGRMTEEREVLWIEAEVLAGRTDEAAARAARFRRRYPDSMQQSTIDGVLDGARP